MSGRLRRVGLPAGLLVGLLAGLLGAAPAAWAGQPFAAWLAEFRSEAAAAGISAATLDAALDDLQPLPRVIELDRNQPEGRMTFRDYRDRVLTPERVANGRALLRQHRPLLDRVAADYGVQPEFILALWGVESSYGAIIGSFKVVDALATLAHDGRRAAFFRGELLTALEILDGGHIPAERMTGSWAGAMGQSQFMPSSFMSRAVDYDGDGRRDIWQSIPDVLASIAHYLQQAGWDRRHGWGREVAVPEGLAQETGGLTLIKDLPQWQAIGVRRQDGQDLPAQGPQASLVRPDDGDGPSYLVYPNFKVLMAWNRSTYFGLTVGQLADRIRHG